jgi:hypothetical protein
VAPKRREVYVSAGWRFVVVGLMITIGWLSSAAVGFGPPVESAQAHLQLPTGTWTWRYYTRGQGSGQEGHCENNTGKVDPTNIIIYQYGEWSRINGHLNDETHWSYWNPVPATTQVICTTTDGTNFNQQVQKDDQRATSNSTIRRISASFPPDIAIAPIQRNGRFSTFITRTSICRRT